MEVTRTSLSSYQGNNKSVPKQVRYAGAAAKGKYGEELRENLSTLGEIRGKAPVIKADAVEAAVSDPNEYTKDAIKTALKKAALALQEGLGKDTTDPTDATISPTTSGGGGGGNKGFFSADDSGNLSYKNMPFVPQSQYKGVETDNLRYGDTMPDGAFGIGSKSTDDFSNLPQYQSSITKEEPRQTVAALPSDYKETEAKAFLDAAAYKAIVEAGLDKTVGGEDAQVNVGSGSLGTFGLGTYGKPAPSGDDLKPGSFGISSIERDTPKQVTVKDAPKSTTTTFGGMIDTKSFLNKMKLKQDAPKQTVASLPSDYKQTEAKAFAKEKSYQDSKAKGEAAAKATNTPTKPPAGSFGISEAGKKEAEANKKAAADAAKAAEAKKKAEAAKKAADAKKAAEAKAKADADAKAAAEAKKAADAKAAADAKKAAEAKAAADAKAKADAKAAADSKAKQAEAKKKAEAAKKQQQSSSTSKSGRKSNTGSKKSSRGGSKSGGGSKGGSKSGGSKSNSGSKKSSRGTSGSRSKGGTSKGGAKTNRRRSRRRCDIRCKFDISVLTNLDLIKDDLAHVAYFVKELQEE